MTKIIASNKSVAVLGCKIHRRGAVRVGCCEKGCRGIMWRVDLSRLEESLGHCGYRCDTCGARVKTVPQHGA